jgi:hypothetical protein
MSAVTTLKKLISRAAPAHEETPPTLGDVTQSARGRLRQALAAKANAEAALSVAEEHLARAESSADAVTTAVAAASAARGAYVSFVQGYLMRGERMPSGADADLREADEAAARELSQMTVQSEAAKGAFPTLHARVQEAREDIGRAVSDTNTAIGEILIATLQSRTHEAHEIVQTLNRHLAAIVAVKDLLRRRGFYACDALGSIPDEHVPVPKFKFSDEQLIANVRPWKTFAQRLLEDPGAQFESR